MLAIIILPVSKNNFPSLLAYNVHKKFPVYGRMANVPSTFKGHLLYGSIESEAQKNE